MKYTQKAKEIDAFTFPVSVQIRLNGNDLTFLNVEVGDYLLFVDGQPTVMPKKEFQAKHDPVNIELTPPKQAKSRKEPKLSKRGLAKPVLELPNGREGLNMTGSASDTTHVSAAVMGAK